MTNSYTLTTTPLLASTAPLRWNIDTTSKQTPLQLANGRIELSGWLLAEGERSPRPGKIHEHARIYRLRSVAGSQILNFMS
ncbi:hypothetical protein HV077_25750 [Citrobacter freundii]|uniref:Uncharacterized protein n=1 Tax=Citrobacter freundii TaxID=546 RepID=A0A7W3D9V9_CITFR|nr:MULTISPECIES: hypothetical protein [Enterobacteriaceae]MBA8065697.1 hypothetical protein [Citrobacter freundii]